MICIYIYMHRRSYQNGCEIFAQQKNVFLITLKNIAHYHYNGFEENIYMDIYIIHEIFYFNLNHNENKVQFFTDLF